MIQNNTAVLVSTLTFLLGLIVGHRLALGRDKRKEWNSEIREVRSYLVQSSNYPKGSKLTIKDPLTDRLCSMLPWWKRRGFRKAVCRYTAAHQNCKKNEFGELLPNDPDEIAAAANALLKQYILRY